MCAFRINAVRFAAAAALIATIPISNPAGVARADAPGEHPHFLHAIADLREARGILRQNDRGYGQIARRQRAAIDDIGKAIGFARTGAVDDGKSPNDDIASAHHLGRQARLKAALNLLHDAENEMAASHEADADSTHSLGDAAKATGDAAHEVDKAIHADRAQTAIFTLEALKYHS
jgi:hypothetical protein